jgi:hypothetical protein
MEEPPARVDRRRNRAEMGVELALGDCVEQRALRLRQRARRRQPVARAAASRAIGHRKDGRRLPGRTGSVTTASAAIAG